MSFEEVRAAALALPREQREQLADELNGSMDDGDGFTPTPELLAELDQREAYLKAHPESARPWEEVRRRLRERYGD